MKATGGGDGDGEESSDWTYAVSQRYRYLLDKLTPYIRQRWMGFGVILLIYVLRVCIVQGYYIITYGLGIYILQLLITFLSPQVDPEVEEPFDGLALPTHGSDEFRPFVRRLPEFKFWYSITKAVCLAFVLTFFCIFDIPVFWPILLFYWIVLFVATMRRQIKHMIKHRYVPYSFGKRDRKKRWSMMHSLLEAESSLLMTLQGYENYGLKSDDATYTMFPDGFCKKGYVKMGFQLLKEMHIDVVVPKIRDLSKLTERGYNSL